MTTERPRRAFSITIALSAALLALTGCALPGGEEPTSTATASTASATLATVDPSLIEGFDVRVDESLDHNHLLYVAVAVVPGLEAWADSQKEALTPRLERFVTETDGADAEPYPELMVGWDVVAASPEVVGMRVHTSEVSTDAAFDGSSWISYYDVAADIERPSQDLLAEGAEVALAERVQAAAAANPVIDPGLLEEQLAGDRESFDALAFTPEGQLWVEFDRSTVSTSDSPLALAVDPESLLSEFGTTVRDAALSPTDPGLGTGSTAQAGSTSSAAAGPAGDVDCSAVKCAALTFDDGPVAGTADLLDVLAEKGVYATFFVVGTNAQAHPEILARMAAEGHVVGNHTLDHPQLTRLSESEIRREIETTADLIEQAGAPRPTLLRPPYGATNEAVAAVAADLGISQINWNVDPEDWKDRDSAVVTQRVLANTKDGSIVLSHDIHETTRDAYTGIIDGLLAQGFTLVTVPDLIDDLEPGQVYYSR